MHEMVHNGSNKYIANLHPEMLNTRRSPSVLLNGATSASRKPQALRHRTNGLYDASVCGQPHRLYLVRARKRARMPRPAAALSACNHPESASGRATSSGSSDQSSPVLLSSVDVTRPVSTSSFLAGNVLSAIDYSERFTLRSSCMFYLL